MDMRLIIDADTCVGYGECVAEDAEAMEIDEQACAQARVPILDAVRAQRICAACPVGAITAVPVG